MNILYVRAHTHAQWNIYVHVMPPAGTTPQNRCGFFVLVYQYFCLRKTNKRVHRIKNAHNALQSPADHEVTKHQEGRKFEGTRCFQMELWWMKCFLLWSSTNRSVKAAGHRTHITQNKPHVESIRISQLWLRTGRYKERGKHSLGFTKTGFGVRSERNQKELMERKKMKWRMKRLNRKGGRERKWWRWAGAPEKRTPGYGEDDKQEAGKT